MQVQIAVLKDEKRKLVEHLKEVQQHDVVDNKKHSQRDMGVMCGVIMRHVGVGPNYPKTRDNSTITEQEINKKFETALISQSSQTKVQSKEANTQIPLVPKKYTSTGSVAKPETKEFIVQVEKESRTIGVSDDDVKSILCLKCNAPKRTVGVGPLDSDLNPVSLKSLTVPKSKSFNLGEEKLNLNLRYRTIGCQSETFSSHKSCQYESKSHNQFSQTEIKQTRNEYVQYESRININQITDTNDLMKKRDASCGTSRLVTVDASSNTPVQEKEKCKKCEQIKDKRDVGCETIKTRTVDSSSNTVDNIIKTKCNKCLSEGKGDKKEDKVELKELNVSGSGSRIPRLAHNSTPTEVRKFKRQDTYTKIPAEQLR